MNAVSKVRRLLESTGSARARDLNALGLANAQLGRLVEQGKLVRLARGVYALADREPDELESLAVVAQRAPNAIFCLLTALRFHGLTTQAPREIWIGIAKQRNPPPLTWPPLRVVRFSGVGLTLGVETHIRNGLPLKVTGIARTVVDCFKFRNKIGLDVALESLSEVRRNHRATIDDIWKTAAPLRMTNVMRPYLESLA